ncbi:MAG: NUDIX domain-containing protein [Armatimonadota bacterium]|nr:NUDIX domain-containing protein [Armatimonadota bacterium]MDW8156492.1 NUDIX domain-containing protein [Armatimonadota bacterium]
MSKMDEEVLVVPRGVLLGGSPFTGMRPPEERYLRRIREHGTYRRRGDVEEDRSFKQVIPYVVVRRGDEVFLFRRLGRGGEARLHHLYSVGVGGHISRADVRDDPVQAGLARELEEELEFSTPWTARWIGVLNDERNAVSAVHFGLVYEARTAGEVRVREREVLEGRFVPLAEAVWYYDRMESWSQLVVDGLGWRAKG